MTARERVPGLDVGVEAFEREFGHGGGLLAGGLAYHLFLWLLPLGLVGAQALGYLFESSEEGVEDAAKEFGLGATAVASAAHAVATSDTHRILLLLIGLWLLAWFSIGVVRALGIAYSLAWGLPRPRIRRPHLAVLVLNGLFVASAIGTTAIAWLREQLGLVGLLGVAVTLAFQTTLALFAMWLLPRRTERWQDLLPGALLMAAGVQVIGLAVVLYFAPKIGRSSELYGGLGTAAVILVWLYLVARLAVDAAFLNATIWERRGGAGLGDDGEAAVDDHGLAPDHPRGG